MKIIHQLEQGSELWHQFRSEHFGASEAAIPLGLSKYKTRSDFLKEKSTGIKPDISDYTQLIFNRGHEVEALARPIIEAIYDIDLYPVTCSDGKLSASCDGLTLCETIAWEHKQWNEELAKSVRLGILPKHHLPQCYQVLMITGAEKLIFTVSDGTKEKMVSMEVLPHTGWFEDIREAWAQFEKDLADYQHIEIIEPAKAEPIKDLPSVIVQVSGALERCNIDDVRPQFDKFLAEAIIELVTDEDFAQAEAESKIGRETAKRCIATAKSVVDQTLSISEVTRELEVYAARFNAIALTQEKAVKTQKETRKASAMFERKEAFNNYLRALNDEIKPIVLSILEPDWQGAMKNQRLLSSLYGKLDDALADGKIRADASAKDIRVKLAWFTEYVTATRFLFTDLQTIITNNGIEAFQSIVKSRIDDYSKTQAENLEAQRLQIQAEEQRKAEAEQAKKLEAERAAIREEERVKVAALLDAARQADFDKQAKINHDRANAVAEKEKLDAEKPKTAQQILEEKPVTMARVTTTTMQQVDSASNQKRLREDDRKNTPVMGRVSTRDLIIRSVMNSFELDYSSAEKLISNEFGKINQAA